MGAFRADVHRRLALEPRVRWALELPEHEFGGLLWILGELTERSRPLLRIADEHPEALADDPALAECRSALDGATRITSRPYADTRLPFSAALCERIEHGKYLQWAQCMREGDWAELLSVLDAARPGLPALLRLVHAHPLWTPMPDAGYVRGQAALAGLSRFLAEGRRFDIDTARALISDGTREWLGAQWAAIPEAILRAAERVTGQDRWWNFGRTADGYCFAGEARSGRWTFVTVRSDGSTRVQTKIPEGELPEHGLAAIKQLPAFKSIVAAHAFGPDPRSIEHYKVFVLLDGPADRTVALDPQGRVIELPPE